MASEPFNFAGWSLRNTKVCHPKGASVVPDSVQIYSGLAFSRRLFGEKVQIDNTLCVACCVLCVICCVLCVVCVCVLHECVVLCVWVLCALCALCALCLFCLLATANQFPKNVLHGCISCIRPTPCHRGLRPATSAFQSLVPWPRGLRCHSCQRETSLRAAFRGIGKSARSAMPQLPEGDVSARGISWDRKKQDLACVCACVCVCALSGVCGVRGVCCVQCMCVVCVLLVL